MGTQGQGGEAKWGVTTQRRREDTWDLVGSREGVKTPTVLQREHPQDGVRVRHELKRSIKVPGVLPETTGRAGIYLRVTEIEPTWGAASSGGASRS